MINIPTRKIRHIIKSTKDRQYTEAIHIIHWYVPRESETLICHQPQHQAVHVSGIKFWIGSEAKYQTQRAVKHVISHMPIDIARKQRMADKQPQLCVTGIV